MKTSAKRWAAVAAAAVVAFCLILGAAQSADPPSSAPSEDVVISFPEVPEGKDAAFYQDLRKQVADAHLEFIKKMRGNSDYISLSKEALRQSNEVYRRINARLIEAPGFDPDASEENNFILRRTLLEQGRADELNALVEKERAKETPNERKIKECERMARAAAIIKPFLAGDADAAAAEIQACLEAGDPPGEGESLMPVDLAKRTLTAIEMLDAADALDLQCARFLASADGDMARDMARSFGISRFMNLVGRELTLEGIALDGTEVNIKDYRGKIVLVLDITLLGPDEVMTALFAYDSFHESGFDVIGYTPDVDLDAWKKYAADHKLPWKTISRKATRDAQDKKYPDFTVDYGINAYPTLLLVDRAGKVFRTHLRDRAVADAIQELLEQEGAQTPAAEENVPGEYVKRAFATFDESLLDIPEGKDPAFYEAALRKLNAESQNYFRANDPRDVVPGLQGRVFDARRKLMNWIALAKGPELLKTDGSALPENFTVRGPGAMASQKTDSKTGAPRNTGVIRGGGLDAQRKTDIKRYAVALAELGKYDELVAAVDALESPDPPDEELVASVKRELPLAKTAQTAFSGDDAAIDAMFDEELDRFLNAGLSDGNARMELERFASRLTRIERFDLVERLAARAEERLMPHETQYHDALRTVQELRRRSLSALEGTVPPVEGTLSDGTEFNWENYRGKYTLLLLCSSKWQVHQPGYIEFCPIHSVKQLYAQYRKAGFEVVGYTNDEPEVWQKFEQENEIPWKTVVRKASPNAGERDFYEFYGISPNSILVGPDGKAIERLKGSAPLRNRLARYLPDAATPEEEDYYTSILTVPEGKDPQFYWDRKRELGEAFFDYRGHNYLWKPGEHAKEERWNKASADATKQADKFLAELGASPYPISKVVFEVQLLPRDAKDGTGAESSPNSEK